MICHKIEINNLFVKHTKNRLIQKKLGLMNAESKGHSNNKALPETLADQGMKQGTVSGILVVIGFV